MSIKAYVFSTGTAYGFSVLSNGSNLPGLLDGTSWTPLRVKITRLADLQDYASDLFTARFNLLSRGYHLCKMPTEATPPPKVEA